MVFQTAREFIDVDQGDLITVELEEIDVGNDGSDTDAAVEKHAATVVDAGSHGFKPERPAVQLCASCWCP